MLFLRGPDELNQRAAQISLHLKRALILLGRNRKPKLENVSRSPPDNTRRWPSRQRWMEPTVSGRRSSINVT